MFFILGFLNIIKNYPCKHVFSHSAWHTKKTIPSVKHIFQKNYILRTQKNENPKIENPKKCMPVTEALVVNILKEIIPWLSKCIL